MMIASPTAASAAATVMTRNTNTWPPTPYWRAKATNARLTAFSISSTHMKTMIALRRVSTPTTPIVNRTAEKNRDSPTIGSPSSQDHGADDGRGEEHAGDLEGEQIVAEQRPREAGDRSLLRDLRRRVPRRQRERRRGVGPREGGDLGEERQAHAAGGELPPDAAGVGDLRRVAEVQQHDDEEEHHHDRARVHEHLDHADELRVEHDVER